MDSYRYAKQKYADWRAEILREDPFATFEQNNDELDGGCVTSAYNRQGYFLGEYTDGLEVREVPTIEGKGVQS